MVLRDYFVTTVEKEDENILLQMDEALETVIEGAGKAVFDLADGLKGAIPSTIDRFPTVLRLLCD